MTETRQDYFVEGEAREIEPLRLGTIQTSGPQEVVVMATHMAKTLAKIIEDQRLYANINGRRYVNVEGWTTLGAMLGIVPREDKVTLLENEDYEAHVSLIRNSDGKVVGGASSIVSSDEKMWSQRPRYARRSMAVTRATGKAYRLGYSWIMTLAGFEPTPAEEMSDAFDGEFREIQQPQRQQPAKPKPQTQKSPEPVAETEPMTIERAYAVTDSKGTPYGEIPSEKLSAKTIGINKGLKKADLTDEERAFYQEKLAAIRVLLQAREDGSL